MTTPTYSIKTHLEDVNDELASLYFDIEHKHHSAMEYFDLSCYRNKLLLEKAELEAKLKAI